MFVETQAVPDFSPSSVGLQRPASSGPPLPAVSPARPGLGGDPSDFGMLESSVEDGSLPMAQPIPAESLPQNPRPIQTSAQHAFAAQSLAFISSPGLGPASHEKQTARQAFAALERDFGDQPEGAVAPEPIHASSEIMGKSFESSQHNSANNTHAEPFTQAALTQVAFTQAEFTQAAFPDSIDSMNQAPGTQAPQAGGPADGASQSQTQSSGLTYVSLPEELLHQAERDALARVQPVLPPPGLEVAQPGTPPQAHTYLQAPAAWAGYGGETQQPFTQASPFSFDKVVRETTSSWDGEGEDEAFVGFTQADVA